MSNTSWRKAPARFLILVKLLKRWFIINRVKSLAWRRCHFKTCLLILFLPKKPTNSFTILDYFFFLFLWSFFLYFTAGWDLFRGQGTVFSTQVSLVCRLLTEIWIRYYGIVSPTQRDPLWNHGLYFVATIGNQTLIKSNINNWIVCKEGTIVRQKARSPSCKMVKQVSQQCPGVVLKSFHLDHRGPHLNGNNLYCYFDGDTRGDWPMWDSLC